MSEEIRESRSVTYASARAAVEGAHGRAEMLGIAVAAAVVDSAGNIVAVGRMDDAPFGVTALAIDKAFTAAAFAAPTDAWQHSTQPGGADWGMHTSLGGRLTVYPGGVPILFDGVVVGAIGVSGGEGSQDVECARAGIESVGLTPP